MENNNKKQQKHHAHTIFPLYTHEHKRLLLLTSVVSHLATSREFPKWLTKPIASVFTKEKMAIYHVFLSRVLVPSNYNFSLAIRVAPRSGCHLCNNNKYEL